LVAAVPMAAWGEVRLCGAVDDDEVARGGIRRRTLLALAGTALLAACTKISSAPKGDDVTTVPYGNDPAQFFEISRPAAASKGVVVVIHGGFWQSQYDLSLGRPLATSLATRGWTAVNLEYRSLGNGGGWPTTFDDVAAGIDALADVEDLDTSTVITLGHSAGGHLAVWAAGRAAPVVPVTAAVPQAGVLNFSLAIQENLGGGAVEAFMGGAPDTDDLRARYRDGDPLAQVPLDVPVRCIHGRDDGTVPPNQSNSYVEAATAAGADATVTMVDGDHFTVIDPGSEAWRTTLKVLDQL